MRVRVHLLCVARGHAHVCTPMHARGSCGAIDEPIFRGFVAARAVLFDGPMPPLWSTRRGFVRAMVASAVVCAVMGIGPGEARADDAVRLRMQVSRGTKTEARILASRADGSFEFLCTTPCTQELAPGVVLRIPFEKDEKLAQTYVVPAAPAADVHMTVSPPSDAANVGYTVGGGLMLVLGLTTLVGDLLVADHWKPEAKYVIGVGSIGLGFVIIGAVLAGSASARPNVDTTTSLERERAEQSRGHVRLEAGAHGVGVRF